jgi:Hg(II)-responsive transcriptional regulator
MTIGQLATDAGVGVETVRFYERRGLIAQPRERKGAYRAYSAQDVDRVRFIRRAKELGFSLAEITELLRLNDAPAAARDDVRQAVRAKVSEIDARIRDLKRMREALAILEATCHHTPAEMACPILEAFASQPRKGRKNQ